MLGAKVDMIFIQDVSSILKAAGGTRSLIGKWSERAMTEKGVAELIREAGLNDGRGSLGISALGLGRLMLKCCRLGR